MILSISISARYSLNPLLAPEADKQTKPVFLEIYFTCCMRNKKNQIKTFSLDRNMR